MSDSIDFRTLTGLEIRALSQEVITAITPEQFASLSVAQLHSLTSTQLTWLTGAQWDALQPAQKSVLFARVAIQQIVRVAEPEFAPIEAPVVVTEPQMAKVVPRAAVTSTAASLPEVVQRKPAVSAIASRFMNPALMMAGEAQNSAPRKVEAANPVLQARVQPSVHGHSNKSRRLAHTAVYVAVLTLLTSGDFLSNAYSSPMDVLDSVWTMAYKPSAAVAVETTLQDEVLPLATLELSPSGLVMPPESALATVPVAPVPQALAPTPVVAKPNPEPNTQPHPQSFTTVEVVTQPKPAKSLEAWMCTDATPSVPVKTALEDYIQAMPRKTSVLSSLVEDKSTAKTVMPAPVSAQRLTAGTGLASEAGLATTNSNASTNISTNTSPTINTSSKPAEVSAPVAKSADPDRYNAASWTTMSAATDLPPRIAALGEDLISVVVKELPSNKNNVNAMSFEEFKLRVKEAVVASPDVGVVSSQVGQSQAAKSLAGSGLMPHVSGSVESGRRNAGRDPYIANSTPYDRGGTNYGFSISQLVYDFGASLSGVRAGEARLLAQQELLNSKKSEQALKTISAFVELDRARAQLKLARQNAASRLDVVKLVKERSELGGGSKADIVRVESKYAEALSSVSLMETRLSNAEATYRELFRVSAKDIVNGPLHEFAIEGLNKNAEELASSYPGLQQLARLRDASLEDYKSASAKALPSVQLVYNNSLNGVNGPTVPVDSPSRSSSMVVQLKYEFYTGGADTARKTDALYKSQQAWEEFQGGMLQYQKVLSQSQAEIRNNEDLIVARKASANSAIDSMRAVREQFSFNRGSLLDLITVQEGLYQAGRDLIDASADRILVRYRLLHLTAQLDKMFDLGTLVSMNIKD